MAKLEDHVRAIEQKGYTVLTICSNNQCYSGFPRCPCAFMAFDITKNGIMTGPGIDAEVEIKGNRVAVLPFWDYLLTSLLQNPYSWRNACMGLAFAILIAWMPTISQANKTEVNPATPTIAACIVILSAKKFKYCSDAKYAAGNAKSRAHITGLEN